MNAARIAYVTSRMAELMENPCGLMKSMHEADVRNLMALAMRQCAALGAALEDKARRTAESEWDLCK